MEEWKDEIINCLQNNPYATVKEVQMQFKSMTIDGIQLGHRDRYIGSLFRTSEPVTMIPDRHMRRPEIVEKIRKAMSVVTPHSQDDSVWQ